MSERVSKRPTSCFYVTKKKQVVSKQLLRLTKRHGTLSLSSTFISDISHTTKANSNTLILNNISVRSGQHMAPTFRCKPFYDCIHYKVISKFLKCQFAVTRNRTDCVFNFIHQQNFSQVYFVSRPAGMTQSVERWTDSKGVSGSTPSFNCHIFCEWVGP